MKLIDKDALVAEIEKIRAKWFGVNNDFAHGQKGALTDVLSLINTLEVKDVDLEEELKHYCHDYYNCDYPKQLEEENCSEVMPHIVSAAKHFFELGIKARKGE